LFPFHPFVSVSQLLMLVLAEEPMAPLGHQREVHGKKRI
jgi:hypothetical protein